VFNRPYFHEVPLRLALPVDGIVRTLHAHNILPGYSLAGEYPELADTLLVCATEMRTEADIAAYAEHLNRAVAAQTAAGCPVRPKMA
jgi:glycine dehydrogenase subunit 1